ncbi:hypothetical protein [Flavobacterium phage FCOV-F18]|nr:hypothetical protein [Flavobacterium phage FCOV-F9]QNJ51359.1 hypothetical protein [Flavobacterium phage FCOV-F8]QNJ51811.1 hypothetical protein [Flavobacterium phage FCOV-F17]QNJ51887.1 hypothetical protein [Flavobacterium phage FCOV-F18]QNJ52267.1 hypothetical protein [Flavobacterium phage FCOV-F23]QNJ52647.1 hypothetical protein [Flavobacterium phage FCOV-F30]
MKLKPNQKGAYEKGSKWKSFALFMKMGSGKTRVCVELVNTVNDLDLVVYIAPLSLVKPKSETIKPIKDEVLKWGGFNCKNVIYVGVESIGMSDRVYLNIYKEIQKTSNVFLIIDESIKIKNLESKRTQRCIELSKMVKYKLILNGQPLTRDLLDLYAQMYFLDPRILNMSLSEFKNIFCKYTTITKRITPTKQYTKEFITGYENIDYLYSLIGNYVYECDLNLEVKQIFETKYYSLDEESKKTYKELKEKYLDNEMMQYKNNNIFLEMSMKMQHQYCITPQKFEIVNDWFQTYPENKTIIYCKYIASREKCELRYPDAIVLNYKSDSHGHNLQDYPYMIYFDGTFDWGDVIQGSHRNYRTGQQNDCRYLTLIGSVGLEEMIKTNNEKKQIMSNKFNTKYDSKF